MDIPDYARTTKADALAIAQGCYWDQAEASAIVHFAETVFRSQYIRGPIKLLEWERRWLMRLYGWRLPNSNRRFRYANLHIAKKNGKTLLVAICSAYEFLLSNEPSPFCVAVAASEANAGQIFKEVRWTINHSKFKPHCKINESKTNMEIKIKATNAEMKCFPTNGDTSHGHNMSLVAIDEAAWIRSNKMWEAVKYNIAARPNGYCCLISTSGSDTSSWYYSCYQKSKNIIAGLDLDITWMADVYESDPDADPEDRKQWYLANPSLGISFDEEQFHRDLLAAKSNVGEWLSFQRLRLNRWVRPDEQAYLDTSKFDNFTRVISEERLRSCPAAIGVDGSQAVDPASVSIVFDLGNREYYVKSWAWVCSEGVKQRERANLPKYEQFIGAGDMKTQSGNRIDDIEIRDKILELCQTYQVQSVNFDPNMSYAIAGQIEREGYKVAVFPQTFRYFNGAMREFEKAWTEGRVYHNGSNWFRYCMGNVRVETNKYNEVRPFRKKSVDHIDGIVSTLLSFVSVFQPEATMQTVDAGIDFI